MANQVFLGNGDGTFGSERDYAPSLNPLSFSGSIAIADFNNDHKPDIATTNGSLLLGNGDGTFQAATELPFGTPFYYQGTDAIADFNGDGLSDIAVSCSSTVYVLLNQGKSNFTLAHTYGVGASALNVPSVVTTDFNGDGKPDLAVVSPGSETGGNWTLSVFLGNGDGSFGNPSVISEGSGNPSQMVVADFNGDSKSDLGVVDQTTGSLLMLLGNGDGTFSAPLSSFAGSGGLYLATADFNGDGHIDVAVSGGSGSGANIAILLGKGDGTFAAPMFMTGAGRVAVGDVNGDGKPDLVADNPVQVFLGKGDGTFTALSPYPSTSVSLSALIDMNGDGILDVAGGTGILLGNGDGTFGAPITLIPPPPSHIGAGVIADANLNADKQPDIVWGLNVSGGNLTPAATAAVWLNTTPATAPGIMLYLASGTSNSATVVAGTTASYNLTIRGLGGFSGTASLTCNGAPTGVSCSMPASVDVSATSNMPFTVTVATTARTTAVLWPHRNSPPLWFWAVSILGIVCLPLGRRKKPLALYFRGAFPIVLILFVCSCGGGGSSSQGSTGTPAGTYTVMVTATSGSMTTSMPLTLVVQ